MVPLTGFSLASLLVRGGGLTISPCPRSIDYCFPYCFLESFVGGNKSLMVGDKVIYFLDK